MRFPRYLIALALAVSAGLSFVSGAVSAASAGQQEEQKDSLVVLLSSKSAQMVDIKGASYRKVIGPARFLHNGTYLLCDTALWNVETRIIEAWGNVSILQEETVLTSEKLTYLIDQDLAEFRGTLVQLTDKDHNTLRTRYLDYNTADSVAVFQRGGAMRDKDGQIIESISGRYDSKIKQFTFNDDVNMFSDSVFVKTRTLVYESEQDLATFGAATDVWKDDNMLSSDRGWYDKGREVFFFADRVHLMSEDQEGWSDTLFFYRNTSDIEMLGNAQVTDTTRNVFGIAGRIEYVDSISKVTLTREPAVISETEETDGTLDTLYLGADKLVYYTLRKCDIDSLVVESAEKRLKELDVDPVGEYRRKAAEEAAKAAEEAAKNDPNYRPKTAVKEAPKQIPAKPDMQQDSLSVNSDSLSVVADSVAMVVVEEPKDTTKIGFLEAIRNVRIYKKSMQVVCDSLLYSDLDSLGRLFKEPVIWQDIRRQYTADSITVVVDGGSMRKASLMSNAFITIEEDTTHFDQIKGTEMLAYFDDKGGLTRFDVLGGASALFYIEENGVFATVNKPESKMLSATFKDGELQRIYYYDQPKNDGYPVVQLSQDEQRLKGYDWQPDRRPADRYAVTPLSLRPSERLKYAARPKTKFRQTDIYFPGYMKDVYRQIAVRDSLKLIRERERKIEEARAAEKARLDSIALAESHKADSLARMDSLAMKDSLDKIALSDTLAVKDSLEVAADSLACEPSDTVALTPEQEKAMRKAEKAKIRAEKKAAREARKKAKQEALEAKWAELDRRDAEKAAAKEAKRLEKERRRKRKALEDQADQQRKDLQALEKYRRKFEKQRARQSARRQKSPTS